VMTGRDVRGVDDSSNAQVIRDAPQGSTKKKKKRTARTSGKGIGSRVRRSRK
jgi:hypothetical protein